MASAPAEQEAPDLEYDEDSEFASGSDGGSSPDSSSGADATPSGGGARKRLRSGVAVAAAAASEPASAAAGKEGKRARRSKTPRGGTGAGAPGLSFQGLVALGEEEVAALQADAESVGLREAHGTGAAPGAAAAAIDDDRQFARGTVYSSAVDAAMQAMLREARAAELPTKAFAPALASASAYLGPLPGTTAFAAPPAPDLSDAAMSLGDFSSGLGAPSTLSRFAGFTSSRDSGGRPVNLLHIEHAGNRGNDGNGVSAFLAALRLPGAATVLARQQFSAQQQASARLRLGLLVARDEESGETSSATLLSSPASLSAGGERLRAAAAGAIARAATKKLALTKVVKFAGETRMVTHFVAQDSQQALDAAASVRRAAASAAAAASIARASGASAPSSSSAASSSSSSSLDAIVASLDKPEAISTLVKTSLDWEQFKAEQGLDEGFEARAAQGGFVERSSFLARVDDRAQESERLRRAEERRARDLQGHRGQ